MAGRHEIDLTPYQSHIIHLFTGGKSVKDISEYLSDRFDLNVKPRTLSRRLADWNIRQRHRPTEVTPALKARITVLFFQCCLSDEEMATVLEEEGYTIGRRTLQRIRLKMNLRRSITSATYERMDNYIQEIVQKELDGGSIEGFGRGLLYTHFRSKMHIISRDRLFATVKKLDPDGVSRRRNDLQRVRGEYIVPGPNYIWSIDGHDKLRHWGIEIYAAIDAYSRYIVWMYVGITNRTAVSVLQQFIQTVQDTGIQPLKIRSDRGVETPLLAAAHYALRKEQDPNVGFDDCYWFGTSTSNQRIESWWAQLQKSLLFLWRDYFESLQAKGLYIKNRLADRIALLSIYIPILRAEVHQYVRTWNHHQIRAQKSRPNSVAGKPWMLYHYPADDISDWQVTPNQKLMNELEIHTASWDIDEYLPAETQRICSQILTDYGYSGPITQSDFLPDGTRVHKQAYIHLRQELTTYISSQTEPKLSESLKPTGAWSWNSDLMKECYETARNRFNIVVDGNNDDEI